jgi:hypothetical protein
MPVPTFGPRMVCTRCGIVSADAQPNWLEKPARQMLADAPHGCTEPALRAHGFTVGLLVGLVGAGLAVAKPDTMKAAGRSFSVVRFVITALGRAMVS